jgi:hypothetical protein
MRKEQLVESVRQHNPLLAEAVDGMIDYVTERCPAAYPSRKQTEAVNAYLKSVHADGDGSMSTRNCEHRRIASMKITIHCIPALGHVELDRLQSVLDRIAYDKEYYMPERGCGFHR